LTLADVTLYNLPALRRSLRLSPRSSIHELLSKGFHNWGTDLFSRLDGEFSLVFHHAGSRSIAARDPLGLRPLYYCRWRGRYHFARTIDELLALPGFPKRPDLHALRDLLHRGAPDFESTLYEGIFRVPPAHWMELTLQGTKLHRYWFPERIETDYSLALPDAAERFRERLKQAMEKRLGPPEETAFELSGGLDSSSLVALSLSEKGALRPSIYSLVFPGMDCDESFYIDAMEKQYHCTIKKIDPFKSSETVLDVERSFHYHPHWPQSITFAMYLPMLSRMRSEGKRILISGQGGDHLLGGSCYLLGDLLRRRKYSALLREFPGLYTAPFSVTPRCLLAGNRLLHRFKNRRNSPTHSRYTLFGLEQVSSPLKRHELSQLFSPAESALRDGNIFHSAREHFDLEYRHPFFDRELVEFLLSLPPEYKYSRGWSKLLLRYALAEILPAPILSRRDKAEFSSVLYREIVASDLQLLRRKSRLIDAGLIEAGEVSTLLDDFECGAHRRILQLRKVLDLELWFRFHFS